MALTTGATAGYGFAIGGGLSLRTNTAGAVTFTPTASVGTGAGPIVFSGSGITIPTGSSTRGKIAVAAAGVIAGLQVSKTGATNGASLVSEIANAGGVGLDGYVDTYPNGTVIAANDANFAAKDGYAVSSAGTDLEANKIPLTSLSVPLRKWQSPRANPSRARVTDGSPHRVVRARLPQGGGAEAPATLR